MRNITIGSFCLLMAVLIAGCGRDEANYKAKLNVQTNPGPALTFDRYEDVLFNIDTSRFQETLLSIQQDYLPFLEGDLTDVAAVDYLKDFALDTFSHTLYQKVKINYPDLVEVDELLSGVYQHFNYYYPEIQLPAKVYTCVSGINPDVPPVMLADNSLVLSLDWYLDHDTLYEQIGMPKYRAERTGKLNMAKDVSELLWASFLPDRHKQTTVLDEMVHEGKRLFFAEAMTPTLPDEVLLGYSKEQLQWAQDNEGNLWADIVGNQRLYSSEYDMFRTFFADGPFTHEYSYDAPARLGEFLGLHIVRSYMDTHDVTLQELMGNDDLQGIFLDSGYKPKK